MTNIQNLIVPVKGYGKPDYSREVSLGQVRPGITLKQNQQFLYFMLTATPIASSYGWVVPPIAVGAHAHLINPATNLPLPYIIPQGYIQTIIEILYAFDQDSQVWHSLEFVPGVGGVTCNPVGPAQSGQCVDRTQIQGASSAILDPTGALAHPLDMWVDNLGSGIMTGTIEVIGILEAVGTPPFPTEKTCRCKYCGALTVVPVTQTGIICSKCGSLYAVFNTAGLRKTP